MKPISLACLSRPFLTAIATALCLSFLHAAEPAAPAKPPEAWAEWAKWADALHSAGDGQGHGPDVGSDEWAAALGKQLGVTDAEGHGPDLKSKEWRAAVEKKLAGQAAAAGEDRQLLSSHDTVARFTGIKDHRCMGRTALCPDRCGDSGNLASFTVVRYLDYRKPGDTVRLTWRHDYVTRNGSKFPERPISGISPDPGP